MPPTPDPMTIADLVPDPRNARRHSPRNVGLIAHSLHEVGAARSIVIDEEGTILAGNATVEAAAEAGIERVQVVDADGETIVAVRRRGLTAEQKARLALLDNRTAELAGWDAAQLLALAEEGVPLGDLWRDEEWAEILAQAKAGDAEPPEDPGPQLDKAEELREKWGCQPGQLWEIPSKSVPGKCHRLLCGDSTKAEDVARLMEQEKAHLFATDPPYGANAGNIGFTAQRDDIEAITKDDLEGEEMQHWLEGIFRVWIPHLTDNTAWYLWHPMLTQGYFAAAAAAAAADLIIHRQIIWKKEQFIFGRGDYHWRHELCFYGWRQGHRPAFYGERNQDTIWEVDWGQKRGEVGHPTAKPPELFAIPMRNHLKCGELAAEPFAGSGSQFVAGEQEGRRVYGMEIEPKYVAVTLQRLADMGLEPCLASE